LVGSEQNLMNDMVTKRLESIDFARAKFLACPRCHGPLVADVDGLRCVRGGCTHLMRISHAVMLAEEPRGTSFFDDTHGLMSATTRQRGTLRMFYSQQTNWADMRLGDLGPGERVVADVGCGPRLPYRRSQGFFLVGVDASLESIRLNEEVDLRIFGSSSNLPFRNGSVDMIVCFYLFHHLVGRRVNEHYVNLENTFKEFCRVLKPGGRICAFDVDPLPPVFAIQRATWNLARQAYQRLDMFFWSARAVREISSRSLPAGTSLLQHEFNCPFWVTFPFVFAWPRILLPRCLYPFRAVGYEWRLP
jgi:SAM-dependent methyltransferase